MKSKYKFNGTLKKRQYKRPTKFNFYLKESDFYPPDDNRVLKSNIEDKVILLGGINLIIYNIILESVRIGDGVNAKRSD